MDEGMKECLSEKRDHTRGVAGGLVDGEEDDVRVVVATLAQHVQAFHREAQRLQIIMRSQRAPEDKLRQFEVLDSLKQFEVLDSLHSAVGSTPVRPTLCPYPCDPPALQCPHKPTNLLAAILAINSRLHSPGSGLCS